MLFPSFSLLYQQQQRLINSYYFQQITAITATILLPTEANSASHKAQAKAIISTQYFQLCNLENVSKSFCDWCLRFEGPLPCIAFHPITLQNKVGGGQTWMNFKKHGNLEKCSLENHVKCDQFLCDQRQDSA